MILTLVNEQSKTIIVEPSDAMTFKEMCLKAKELAVASNMRVVFVSNGSPYEITAKTEVVDMVEAEIQEDFDLSGFDRTPLMQAQARVDALILLLAVQPFSAQSLLSWLYEFSKVSDYPGVSFDARTVINRLMAAGVAEMIDSVGTPGGIDEFSAMVMASSVVMLAKDGVINPLAELLKSNNT